jgi:hypothetical protein
MTFAIKPSSSRGAVAGAALSLGLGGNKVLEDGTRQVPKRPPICMCKLLQLRLQ